MTLAGKTVMVTGASRGIGRAMALACAEAGADLVVTARTVEATAGTCAAAAALGRACSAVALDLSAGRAAVVSACTQAWDAAGGVDVLINNAGNVLYKPAIATDEEDWDDVLATNLSGVFWTCQSLGARMLERGGGKIVNIASDIGIRGEAGWGAYAASKGGVVALSKSLAWEWAPTVTVNIVAPGPFMTDANRPAFDMPEVLESVNARVPLGRVGDPNNDLGPLAVLLAGPGSDFMTGAVFRVDGGICRS